MLKLFNSRRSQTVAAILLVAGVTFFEESHRAGASRPPHPPVRLASPPVDPTAEFNLPNTDFAGQVDLWENPGAPTYNTDLNYANYMFHPSLNAENLAQLVKRSTDNGQNFTLPVTVSGGHLDYAHFSIGAFNANLTLTPLKAKPDDFFPTLLKPGVSGSFNF